MHRFRYIASYLSKVADFDPPDLYLAPPQGVIPVEFRGDLWHQKTRVPVLSCGVVCVILRFVVLVELRLVTDGQTDGQTQTDRHRPMASTADASHRAVTTFQIFFVSGPNTRLTPMSHLRFYRAILSHECATLSQSHTEYRTHSLSLFRKKELRDREKLALLAMSH